MSGQVVESGGARIRRGTRAQARTLVGRVKRLFDENLSARLVALFQAGHPGSAHLEQLLGRGNAGWTWRRGDRSP